jgi:hypothetical protein
VYPDQPVLQAAGVPGRRQRIAVQAARGRGQARPGGGPGAAGAGQRGRQGLTVLLRQRVGQLAQLSANCCSFSSELCRSALSNRRLSNLSFFLLSNLEISR